MKQRLLIALILEIKQHAETIHPLACVQPSLFSHRISSAHTLTTCLTQIQDSVWVWYVCVCVHGDSINNCYCTHRGLGDRCRWVQKGVKGCP